MRWKMPDSKNVEPRRSPKIPGKTSSVNFTAQAPWKAETNGSEDFNGKLTAVGCIPCATGGIPTQSSALRCALTYKGPGAIFVCKDQRSAKRTK